MNFFAAGSINRRDTETNILYGMELAENEKELHQKPLLDKSVMEIDEPLSQQKAKDFYREWGVQQTNHLALVNDLSSAHAKQNYATQNWIDNVRRSEPINEAQYYKDPSQKSEIKRSRIMFWRQKLVFSTIPIIEPTSVYLIIWDLVIFMEVLMYTLFLIGHLYFFWDEQEQNDYWDFPLHGPTAYLHWFVLFTFFVDIIIKYHVAYFKQGAYIVNRYEIARHYLKNGFAFDLIPWLTMFLTSVSSYLNYVPWIHYLFLLKYYSIFEIDRRIRDRLQLHRKSKAIYLILLLIVELIFMIHLFAAVFYRTAVFMFQNPWQGGRRWQTWINFSSGNYPDIYQYSRFDQYIVSMYWSFATLTTVAYGDITPMNPFEIQVSQLAMIGAVFIFAFNVQIIFEIVDDYRETQLKFQKYLIIINRFMRDKEISYQLQNKIRKYLDHIWNQQRARDENIEDLIINQLAPQLKEELMYESYGKFLISIPWFREAFSFEFVREVSQDVEEVHYSKNETIFLDHFGEEDDYGLYFLNQGEVELFMNIDQNLREDVVIARIQQGSSLGQYSFITGDQRQCSARSASYIQMYRVRRSKFLTRMQNFPADYERFCLLRNEIEFNKRFDLLNINCFTCQANDHMANNCPLSHYVGITLKQKSEEALTQAQEENLIAGTIQKRSKTKRNNKKKKNKIHITEEQLEEAKRIEQNDENPEQINENLAQLMTIQKLAEPIEDQVNEDVDQIKNFQYFYPDSNIEDIIQREGQQPNIMIQQPRKREVQIKTNKKLNSQSHFAPKQNKRG